MSEYFFGFKVDIFVLLRTVSENDHWSNFVVLDKPSFLLIYAKLETQNWVKVFFKSSQSYTHIYSSAEKDKVFV